MLNRDVCMQCLKNIRLGEDVVYEDRYWPCKAYDGHYIDKKQNPPKRCHKLFEQGVAAAACVNIDIRD